MFSIFRQFTRTQNRTFHHFYLTLYETDTASKYQTKMSDINYHNEENIYSGFITVHNKSMANDSLVPTKMLTFFIVTGWMNFIGAAGKMQGM